MRSVLFNKKTDNSKYTVSPNPVKSQLSISGLTGEESISVWNAAGTSMYQGKEKQIDVAAWPAGIYIVFIESKAAAPVHLKIIKE